MVPHTQSATNCHSKVTLQLSSDPALHPKLQFAPQSRSYRCTVLTSHLQLLLDKSKPKAPTYHYRGVDRSRRSRGGTTAACRHRNAATSTSIEDVCAAGERHRTLLAPHNMYGSEPAPWHGMAHTCGDPPFAKRRSARDR